MTLPSGDDPTVGATDATTPESVPVSGPRVALGNGAKIGRYQILRALGRGGMGAVYLANDPQLERQVAIKLLHAGASSDSLIHEAKALAKLDDRHVVQVFDAGEHAGEVFVAMQLVDGDDLAAALGKREPRVPQIIEWFVDAARGLAAAHAAGLVHRDFKPSNVLIDRKGRVAVTDFGLAVSTSDSDGKRSGFAGTPVYMAPEQHALQPATEAADQFAFCAALWEALFHQHPYIPKGGATSAAEVGMHITTGELIPPPREPRVPKQVIDALTRGLSRDPAQRWPSMNDLIAQLAPAQRRARWPLVAIGVAAAAASGVGVWLYAGHRGPSCDAQATQRLAIAWNPQRAAALHQHFAGRSYAATTADAATKALDSYGTRWRQLAIGACEASTSELAARERACLDARLDSLHATTDVLEGGGADVVDHAREMADSLPPLADCANHDLLMAGPGTAPRDKAAQIAALDRELDRIAALHNASSTHTLDDATKLVARAEALGWAPTIARAHIAHGKALSIVYKDGALDELLKGAGLAFASHLESDAVEAWIAAIDEAWYRQKPDIAEMVVTQARTTAAHLGNPALALKVEVAYGRALIQMQHWNEGLAICRTAIGTADKLGNERVSDNAHDCVFEGLLPLGDIPELHKVTAERIASITERFGPDDPRLATYNLVLAEVDAAHGDLANARTEIDRAVAVVTKAYPDGKTLRNVEVTRVLAQVEVAEGKATEGLATYRKALAMANQLDPTPVVELAQIQTGIAMLVQASGDRDAAIKAYDDAIAAARLHKTDRMPLAMLLLNDGMLIGETDFAAGLRDFDEARQIMNEAKDPRAAYASTAMAVIEAQHERWADARRHAEEAVEFAKHDPDADPENTAAVQLVLAKALLKTKGDKARAKELAREAHATLVKLGPGHAKDAREAAQVLASIH
ncbi:MAG: protein kinase [Deltaproteobacteria bacterium]|nr:protein kinase [Deltaproteobacteria bacterium]